MALLTIVLAAGTASAGSFVTFESGQVRPLALSPDGRRLFAVDTPDGRLEIFDVGAGGLTLAASVPVGLEPVAVAARSDGEVWVVNHLSDSVSVVDVGSTPPRVTRTLLVGDEPRDIVFAGPGRGRAFVTTAHRGQNSRIDPELTTPGVGRADVWVFDAAAPGTSLGGDPLTIVTLFCDTPRALAASPDGAVVYAAAFRSGNQTVTVPEGSVCDGGQDAVCEVDGRGMPGGLPAPNANVQGVQQPEVGLIVKFDPATGSWLDPIGRDWRSAIRLALPDTDVFAIDAVANPPVVTAAYAHVGTVIYNLAVNPVSGAVYATNTEARNEVRFSGHGILAGSSVRGHLHEARITVIDGDGVRPRHLNPHIDYGVVPSPPGTMERSLATPTGMAVSGDGSALYVAALGSSTVAVLDAAGLEAGGDVATSARRIAIPGGGPSGLVLDEARARLYVLSRFDDAIAVIDLAGGSEVQHVRLYDPEPASVVGGRPLLYDATITSSNGEASCASCHVFAVVDALAWDLGDPDAPVVPDPNPVRSDTLTSAPDYHPMKGPLTTQTLRGLATRGAMHWRGDRTGGYQPGVDPRDERAAFLQFNAAFDDLLGRGAPLTDAQMEALARFVLQITPPPNPVRALDGSLTPVQEQGREQFEGCRMACHVIDPSQGFFGTDGFVAMSGTNPTQFMKIAHLDTFYEKVGMFVMPPPFNLGDTTFTGDQVRGFGFTHDGAVGFYNGSPEIEQFLLAFEGVLAPIVGQQVTLDAAGVTVSGPRVDLLIQRAAAGECDLTVKGTLDGEQRGWYRTASGTFRSDRTTEPEVSDAELRAQAALSGQERTYTCVPPGSGVRVGVDRDQDRVLDRDEIDLGSDPSDATSVPFSCPGGEPVARARVKLGRDRHAAGHEAFVVRGEATLGTPLDPVAGSLRVSLADPRGIRLVAGTSPGEVGWRSNRAGTRWTFVPPPGEAAGGITWATVRDRSDRAPGLVAFKIAGRSTGIARDLPSLPVQFAIAAGPAAAPCATSVLALEACRVQGSGTVVVCR
jgi:YVTN family beta-propeller protein